MKIDFVIETHNRDPVLSLKDQAPFIFTHCRNHTILQGVSPLQVSVYDLSYLHYYKFVSVLWKWQHLAIIYHIWLFSNDLSSDNLPYHQCRQFLCKVPVLTIRDLMAVLKPFCINSLPPEFKHPVSKMLWRMWHCYYMF